MTAVTSFTLGNAIQRDNFEDFIKENIIPNMTEERCNVLCEDYLGNISYNLCLSECRTGLENQTEETVMNITNQIYSQGIFNMNLESFSNMLNDYFIHFIIVAIASGTLIIIISKSVYRIGINFILIGVTSLTTALITNMIEIPDVHTQTIADYLFGAMYQQIYFGVAFLIIGIMLMIADKYFK